MFLRTWRWLTLMFVALSLAPALGHLLEMPAKMRYEGPLWLTISQTLYGAFGTVGGAFEAGAVITTVVLVLLVRRRHPAFGWTLLAALCVLLAHAAFWIWLAPPSTPRSRHRRSPRCPTTGWRCVPNGSTRMPRAPCCRPWRSARSPSQSSPRHRSLP